MSKNIGTFNAKAGLDVSEWAKSTVKMSTSLKAAVDSSIQSFDGLESRSVRSLLKIMDASDRAGNAFNIDGLIAKYKDLDVNAQRAFASQAHQAVAAAAKMRAAGVAGMTGLSVSGDPAQAAEEQAMAAREARLRTNLKRWRDQKQAIEQAEAASARRSAQIERELANERERIANEEIAAEERRYAKLVQMSDAIAAARVKSAAKADRQIVMERAAADSKTLRGVQDWAENERKELNAVAAEKERAAIRAAQSQQAERDAIHESNLARAQEGQRIREAVDYRWRLLRIQGQVNELVRSGNITQAQGAQYMNLMNSQVRAQSAGFSRHAVIMQQAGYQVQDFFVQVASGQNAMVAFSQQSTQLLSFLGKVGMWSAVAISVGTVAYQFYKAATEAEQATNKFKSAKEALDALTKSQQDRRERGFDINPSAGIANASNLREQTKQEIDRRQIELQSLRDQISAMKKFGESGGKVSGILSAGAQLAILVRSSDLKEKEAKLAELRNELDSYGNEILERRKKLNEENFAFTRGEAETMARIHEMRRSREEAGMTDFDKLKQVREQIAAMQQTAGTDAYGFPTSFKAGMETDRVGYEKLLTTQDELLRGMQKRADAIKDELEPMRKRIELEKELSGLVTANKLDEFEKQKYLARYDARQQDSFMSRYKSVTEFGAGASALGGTTTASPVIELQKQAVDYLRSIYNLQLSWGSN